MAKQKYEVRLGILSYNNQDYPLGEIVEMEEKDAAAALASGSITLTAKKEPDAPTQETTIAVEQGVAPQTMEETPLMDQPRLNANTATKEELAALRYVGDVIAEAIVSNQPYKSTDEILTKLEKALPKGAYTTLKTNWKNVGILLAVE
jgi:DNA uptake protein ComE-like DNA-binding protein